MIHPHLIGCDDFTIHPMVFTRGIKHKGPQNLRVLGSRTLTRMSNKGQILGMPKICLQIILRRLKSLNCEIRMFIKSVHYTESVILLPMA
jgi:hypothetical protein